MKLRKEILPQMNIAEKYYAEVLKSINDYTHYLDEYGDDDHFVYKKVEEYLSKLTNKDLSRYNFNEWWEEEEKEVLAFRIALPNPLVVENISREELVQVIMKVKVFEGLQYEEENLSFNQEFELYLDEYYHEWLKLNFERYEYKYFIRNRDNQGNYFEYSIEEIADKLLST